MERRHNPYAPGAGLQPPELAGRNRLIEDAAIDMDRLVGGRPTKGMILLGLRGVGKTVVLNRLHHMADEKGIYTAKIEAPEGGTLPQLLAPELRRILYGLDLQTATGGRLRQAVSALRNFVGAFKVKVGDIEFGIEAAPGLADTGNLEQDLPDLVEAVAEAAKARDGVLSLLSSGVGISGLECRARQPYPPSRRRTSDAKRHRSSRCELLPCAFRPPDIPAAEISPCDGATRSRTVQDRRHCSNTRRQSSSCCHYPTAAHRQRHGLEPETRRNCFHGADV